MISPGRPRFDHAGRKNLRAVDHAPEIDGENALPVFRGSEHRAARLNAGIVHQQVRAAEAPAHGGFQLGHFFRPADIDRHGHDIGGPAGCGRDQFGLSGLKTIGAEIGDAHLHAEGGELFGGGKTYSAGASGDDGDMIG